MTKPSYASLSIQEIRTIYDSSFYHISQNFGIETSLRHDSYDESITFSNSFDEIGYGVICIKTLVHARHKVAMRIFPKNLK